MRLAVGQKVVTDRGRQGVITQLHFKNGERTMSIEPTDNGTPFWCYKSQVIELYTANGKRLNNNQ